MPTKNHQVNQITEYLRTKVEIYKAKVAAYESPISLEVLKSSDTMQLELVRLKAQLEAHEDMLLIIQKFTTDAPKTKPPVKKNRPGRKG